MLELSKVKSEGLGGKAKDWAEAPSRGVGYLDWEVFKRRVKDRCVKEGAMERQGQYFRNYLLLVSLFCFLWPVSSKAQTSSANLNGTVTDASGATVPNAKVEVVALDTGFKRQATTGNSGVYSINSLPIGKYDLTISAQGFKTYAEKGIELSVGENRTVDAQL